MLYGETMRKICAKLGVDRKALPDRLYSTLLNAIKDRVSSVTDKKVSGEVARVDDVSPVEQSVSVKVKSKNLFNQAALDMPTKEINGLTITYLSDENCFLINGVSTATSGYCTTYINIEGKINSKYTAIAKYVSGEVSVPEAGFAVAYFGSSDTIDHSTNWLIAPFKNEDSVNNGTLTRKYISRFWFYFTEGVSFNNYKVKIQLEEGDVATEYTPYVDVSTVKVTRCGKNLFPSFDTFFQNGLTCVKNQDGSVTINGTATTSRGYKGAVVDIIAGLYTLSCGCALPAGVWLSVSSGDLMIYPSEQQKTYEISGGDSWLYLYINEGTVFNDFTLYPQVEVGDTATEYEPYKGETYTPNANGTIDGVASVSPTMTIFTDKEGVTLDVEYTRDFSKVVEIIENS